MCSSFAVDDRWIVGASTSSDPDLTSSRGGDTCHVAPQGARCHAAFSGDLAPALIALDAQVELLSPRGTRRMALADCYRDDGAAHLTLERDEVLTRVTVPLPAAGWRSGYRKARVRGGKWRRDG